MGYTTDFVGEVKFKKELTATQLSYLKGFLGRDVREIDMDGNEIKDACTYSGKEHPDSIHCVYSDRDYWYHIDLKFLDDFSGLTWDGSEKTYGLVEIINFLTDRMRTKWEDFEFTGEMNAQGEEVGDVWKLKMKDGKAVRIEFSMEGETTTCPHCKEEFIVNPILKEK